MTVTKIQFGTDGWRAQMGRGFDTESVSRVSHATACAFAEVAQAEGWQSLRIIIGYDTREGADQFAGLAAQIVADTMAACLPNQDVQVVLSDCYVPTPCVCWTIARDKSAIGGIQLTASHNPAGWLGFKVRMSDGGAAPVEFTQRIEELLDTSVPVASGVVSSVAAVDILSPYLDALCQFVDVDAIRAANLKLVVDPLYGAARGYLADTFERIGTTVIRIHDNADPKFGGLHPEPIPPWTDTAANAVKQNAAIAGFVMDGDADRLGAIDDMGTFVSSHKILVLLAIHLVENHGRQGRIVKTLSTSLLVDRIAAFLGVPSTTTPIGFKWIYAEMLQGDVLIGGEESGGIGIPDHIFERDGLLMSLLLAEMMATTGHSLRQLIQQLEKRVGVLYYDRYDLTLNQQDVQGVRRALPTLNPVTIAGSAVMHYTHTDGAKFILSDSEWLLLRASGTEPMVRIYAESATRERTAELLAAGKQLAKETTVKRAKGQKG
ncbi:MAG: phosphoglucosamine mutase [Coriobacteriia bacterium]|nr:phosphoglucosamine mutase [Coriobacteriia bacterium]